MCCLVVVLMTLGPRFGILVWWLADQPRWEAAFSNFFWAFAGFIFVPWTTIMYVLVAPTGKITGFDWLWLALGLMADIGSYVGSGYERRTAAVEGNAY